MNYAKNNFINFVLMENEKELKLQTVLLAGRQRIVLQISLIYFSE